MPVNKILIVDDAADLRHAIREMFEINNFDVFEAHSLAQMWITLRQNPEIDVVLLDLNLPDGDGLQTCRKISTEFDCGLIIMTGRNDHIDKIIGLESGADDYVCKPFELRELVARVRSVIRRARAKSEVSTKSLYSFDDKIFDPTSWKVTNGGTEEVQLTHHESLLLKLLLENAGTQVSRDDLSTTILGHKPRTDDRSIDNLVSRVRKKLHFSTDSQSAILSIRGVGYQFAGDVQIKPFQ